MQVLIRVDASVEIGSGHFCRCFSLAEALRCRGAEVGFVCRPLPEGLEALLQQRDFTIMKLAAAPSFSVDNDAQATVALLQSFEQKPDWLIVDHYLLDRAWESKLRPLVGKIMVIDDLADRCHDSDLLLDQNYHSSAASERYRNLVSPGCRLLLGPRYALLDSSYADVRSQVANSPSVTVVLNVLVFFGGTDPGNETSRVVKSLIPLLSRISLKVVVGSGNPHRTAVRSLCELNGVEFLGHVDDMAALLTGVDLVVGAGGISLWERCCLGVPSIVAAIADNQEYSARVLAQDGYIVYLGRAELLENDDYCRAVAVLLRSSWWREFMTAQGMALVDGRGVGRVVSALLSPIIRLREVRESDSDNLWRWRNAPENRQFSFSASIIRKNEHERWFARSLADPDRILLIGMEQDQPVGVLRYDLTGDEALVSIYLLPDCQGRGYGMPLLQAGESWLRCNQPQIKKLRAEVMLANRSAQRMFAEDNFMQEFSVFTKVLDNDRS